MWIIAEDTGAVEVQVEAEVPEDAILVLVPGPPLATAPVHALLILDHPGSLVFICLFLEIYVTSSQIWKADSENVISG